VIGLRTSHRTQDVPWEIGHPKDIGRKDRCGGLPACMHAYACMHACMHMHACMDASMYACMHVCMHMHAYACMLCCAMLCYAMPCHGMPCHAIHAMHACMHACRPPQRSFLDIGHAKLTGLAIKGCHGPSPYPLGDILCPVEYPMFCALELCFLKICVALSMRGTIDAVTLMPLKSCCCCGCSSWVAEGRAQTAWPFGTGSAERAGPFGPGPKGQAQRARPCGHGRMGMGCHCKK